MNKVEKLKQEIKEKIDKFEIANSTVYETLIDSEPLYSLNDCETLDEINEYLSDYITNIDDAIETLEKFNNLLENIDVSD